MAKQLKPIPCVWCDPNPGGRCRADLVLIAGEDKGEHICNECWLNHNRFGICPTCSVKPLEED